MQSCLQEWLFNAPGSMLLVWADWHSARQLQAGGLPVWQECRQECIPPGSIDIYLYKLPGPAGSNTTGR